MTNKKHFTSILSAICVVLVLAICAVLLVACGPKQEIVEVGPKEEIVEVGTYKELVNAFAGDADIVKITQDIKVEDTLNVTRTFKLDLNGKKLYNETPIWVKDMGKWSIISVRANGDLTITGNGTIHALKDDCYALDVVDGGKLVIESGIFIGNVSAVYVLEGTAEIKGGEYSIQQLSSDKDYRFTLNLYDANGKAGTASIVVIGGTFHNFDPSDNLAENPKVDFVAEGYTSTLQEGNEDIYEVIVAPQE